MILPFRLRATYLRLGPTGEAREYRRIKQALIAALVVLEEQQVRQRRREMTAW